MFKLQENWTRLNDAMIGTPAYWDLAIQNRSFWLDMEPIITAFAAGETLDIGAGRLAWRQVLRSRATRYVSADMFREHPDLDVIADLTQRLPWDDALFSTIFCCSVLEHLVDFEKAIGEMRRVLKPGGCLILAVPFMYYRHGDPHDYFRFTQFALKHLADKFQFNIRQLQATGGLAEITLNPLSIFLSSVCFRCGLTGAIKPMTRLMTGLSRWLDHRLDAHHRFATSHIIVLERPL